MTTVEKEVDLDGLYPVEKPAAPVDATGWTPQIGELDWSGPAQRGYIQADPFVMWMAISFVTIIVILYFFLRGVKKPTHKGKSAGKND